MASVYKSLSNNSQDKKPRDAGPKIKERVLILGSRGITYRDRHLMADLYSLLPHARKDAKFDKKSQLYQLNELAELYNSNNICYFEGRKAKDVYLWLSRPPNGPTVKFHLQNRKL